MISPAKANSGPFESLAAALDAPRSACFGLASSGPRDTESCYNRLGGADLTFDISNNQVLCSIRADGLAEYACALQGLIREQRDPKMVGAYLSKQLTAAGPFPVRLELHDSRPVTLHELPGVQADLLGGFFPMFTWRVGQATIRQLAFAPMDVERPELSPRAFMMVFAIGQGGEYGLYFGQPGTGHSIVAMRGPGYSIGQQFITTFAVCLGRDKAEQDAAEQAVRRKTALEWLNDTWRHRTARAGELSIPAESFYAESLLRAEELCRQTVLRFPDGPLGGGFWGSRFMGPDAWETPFIWIKDIYHAMLPMGLFEPRLCADAALWFLEWGMPHAPLGRGVGRFRNITRVNHSLSNSLAAFQLAGEYYRGTGDTQFFHDHPELLAGAEGIFADLFASRQGEVFLFPSLYISDGDARGDYHTGSNVVAWDALTQMARIAREVHGRADLAEQWGAAAEKVRAAILEHCRVPSPQGLRFVEGANADGTFIPGHDGEETDTTLMPFYGFCDRHDDALVEHARLAFTKDNPLYWPAMDGVWWTDGQRRFGATAPAWMTALASAVDEGELARQLLRIRRLTDLDGSIWWWPYRDGDTDITAPGRAGGMKSAWAAGVYCCMFVHDILGLRADRPARTAVFRPACPWPEFSWRGARLGESVFDVIYSLTGRDQSGEITNRNAEPYDVRIELLPPVVRDRRRDVVSVVKAGRIGPGESLRLDAKLK